MSMDTSWIASAKYVEDEDGGKTITVIHTDGRYFSIPLEIGTMTLFWLGLRKAIKLRMLIDGHTAYH